MWFQLNNIKSSSIFNIHIFYFIFLVTPNYIITIPNPVLTLNDPPQNLETESGSTTQLNNKDFGSPLEASSTNNVQDPPNNNNNFLLGSLPSILQAAMKNPLGKSENQNQKTKSTDDPNIAVEENPEDPFAHMTLGMDDELPLSSTKLEDQENTLSKSSSDLWEDFENYDPETQQKLNTNQQTSEQDNPQEHPFIPLENSMLGTNDDQLVGPTAYLDQEMQQEDYNTDKEENLKTIRKMVQQDTPQENYPLKNSMLGANDDQFIEPMTDQETQQEVLDAGINSQEHVQDTTIPVLQSELYQPETLISSDGVENTNLNSPAIDSNSDILNQMKSLNSELEQQLLLNDTPIDSIDNNDVTTDVMNNNAESTDILGPETSQINLNSTNLNDDNNGKRKKKKVPYKLEYTGDARMFCTFGTKMKKFYRKVKKYFVDGELCQAIVFGNPLTIRGDRVLIGENENDELIDVHTYKNSTLLVVIMQHSTYEDWSASLKNPKKQVNSIMEVVNKYQIDGIQFSNLEPSPGDQLDTDMTCKLIKFFEMLTKTAENRKRELKIGISLSPFAQSITTGFHEFEVLNDLVNWYSLHTISMVQCSPEYLQGTSPLKGLISMESSFLQLMTTDIRKNKVIISIQLYANKFDSLAPHTYREMCSLDKESWKEWCAARPEDYRRKGEFLRNLEIWGVQLYYMESDDYKAVCDCYTFPMIRALLRGMAQRGPLEEKCEYLGQVKNQPSKCSYKNILPDIEARVERQYLKTRDDKMLENTVGS